MQYEAVRYDSVAALPPYLALPGPLSPPAANRGLLLLLGQTLPVVMVLVVVVVSRSVVVPLVVVVVEEGAYALRIRTSAQQKCVQQLYGLQVREYFRVTAIPRFLFAIPCCGETSLTHSLTHQSLPSF
jgi:hypothetical protein